VDADHFLTNSREFMGAIIADQWRSANVGSADKC
jgi:hypothetical protein